MDNKKVEVKREKVSSLETISSLPTVFLFTISSIILILGIFTEVKNSNFIYFFGITFLSTAGNIFRMDYKFLRDIKLK